MSCKCVIFLYLSVADTRTILRLNNPLLDILEGEEDFQCTAVLYNLNQDPWKEEVVWFLEKYERGPAKCPSCLFFAGVGSGGVPGWFLHIQVQRVRQTRQGRPGAVLLLHHCHPGKTGKFSQ